jgi:hypothetical protein
MTPRPRKATAKILATDDAALVVAAPETVAVGDEAAAPLPAPEIVAAPLPPPEEVTPFVAVRVLEAAMVLPNPNPFLILEEIAPPKRRLSIPVGLAEGTAIGFALRGRPTPKPLTHELFVDVVRRLGGRITAARVTHILQGAYYAEIVVAGPTGEHVLSCRPSDAIALALRQGTATPVVVASALLAQLGTAGASGG